MSTCSKCGCTFPPELSTCPRCSGASVAVEGGEPVADTDPDPDGGSFETGARRRWGDRPLGRGPGARVERRLRLVPRVEGALALAGKRALEAERPEASRTLPLEQTKNAGPAEVVPLRPTAEAGPGTAQAAAARRVPRPPVLASEALRKELLPPTPASGSGRVLLTFVGLAGAATAALVGGESGLGIPLGGAFAALAALALLPMTYQARAAGTVSLGASGLIVVNWSLLQRGRELGPVVLLTGVLVLSTALLFRGWHRASLVARALVAVGIGICATWLWSSAILGRLLVLEGAWQTWLSPLLAAPLPLLLLLSMLAFMDARSTGGACGWASVLLGWYACFSWSGLLQLGWPAGTASFELDRVAPAVALARLGAPLFAIALALGCAQLFANARAAQRPT